MAAGALFTKHKAAAREVMLLQILRTVYQRSIALETRLSRLETAPKGLDYAGTYQRALEYRRNQGVTFKSQLWVCISDAVRGVEPDSSPANWQLAAKADR